MRKYSSEVSSQKSAMRNMRNNNNKKAGIIRVFFFQSLTQNLIQRENHLLPIKLTTGNFWDMEVPLCICASETQMYVFGVFGFICNSCSLSC